MDQLIGTGGNVTGHRSGFFRDLGDVTRRRPAPIVSDTEGVAEIIEGTLPPVKFLPDGSWSPGRSGAQWHDVSTAGIDQPEPLKGKKYEARHMLAIEDFLKAIEENREPRCNMYRGRAITEMIAAIFESHRLGRPVSLPLENRQNPLAVLASG